MKLIRLSLFIFCMIFWMITSAQNFLNQTPLPAEEAFKFNVVVNDEIVTFNWNLHPRYYLYKDKFKFELLSQEKSHLGTPIFPADYKIQKTSLGHYKVYQGMVSIPVPVVSAQPLVDIAVTYQGCSHDGFCYPPMTKKISVNLKEGTSKDYQEDHKKALTLFQVVLMLVTFFGVGILLAFTPCILPMLPILCGIIIGRDPRKLSESLILAISYVIGMAVAYGFLGLIFGYMGQNLQMIMQKPISIFILSLIFLALALSSFNFFSLQLPPRFQNQINRMSNRWFIRTWWGVAFIGILSVLILSPCVTPPLVGALGFISQTGHAWLGSAALFLMGIGMGIPFLIFSVAGTQFLPKTGPWMNYVKNIFGVIFIIMAVVLWLRIIPTQFLHSGPSKLNFITVRNIDDVQRYVKKAQRKNQPVLLDFYAKWCTSCVLLDRTFQKPEVAKNLSKFLLLRADITQNNKDDQALMKAYGVIAPPTILFFAHGKELPSHRIVGEINARSLIARLKEVGARVEQVR